MENDKTVESSALVRDSRPLSLRKSLSRNPDDRLIMLYGQVQPKWIQNLAQPVEKGAVNGVGPRSGAKMNMQFLTLPVSKIQI